MKRIAGRAITLLLLVICLHFAVYSQQSPAFGMTTAFSFNNQSSFLDENKIYHGYAEIKNESPVPLKNIIVTAEFFDGNNVSVGEYKTAPALNHMNPGEISPLEIQYLDAAESSRIVSYKLTATGEPGQRFDSSIKILSANSRLDPLGTLYINVVAVNQANVSASNSLTVASLYDNSGKLIAIGKALAEAVAGSSDIPAGATAPFGIAITEKLQTYKGTHYSLVIISDTSESDRITVDTKSSGYNSSPSATPVSRCIIATAAFGSDLAPQVQELRLFRDDIALHTFSGSSFMTVFNEWYYSFSPQIALYERSSPWLQAVVRLTMQPLLGILAVGKQLDGSLINSTSSEIAIIISGEVTAALIGVVYLSPFAAIAALVSHSRKLPLLPKPVYWFLGSWSIGIGAIIIGLIFSSNLSEMTGTSLSVLSAVFSVNVTTFWIVRRGI